MTDCKMVGLLPEDGYGKFEMPRRVYDTNYLSPSIRTMQGGNLEPKIAEPIIYDDYNGRIKADQSIIGTVMPNFGNDAARNGTKIIEPIIAASRGRNPDNPSDRTAGAPTEQRLEIGGNVSNTLTSVQKDNYVIEPNVLRMVITEKGKAFRKQYEAHEIKHGFNEYREAESRTDGISNSLTSVQKDNYVCIPQATKKGYIECEVGGVVDLNYPNSTTRRGRV